MKLTSFQRATIEQVASTVGVDQYGELDVDDWDAYRADLEAVNKGEGWTVWTDADGGWQAKHEGVSLTPEELDLVVELAKHVALGRIPYLLPNGEVRFSHLGKQPE